MRQSAFNVAVVGGRQACREDECWHDGAQGVLVSEHFSQCG